jgi:ferric-dicitrate binding protein FerR (iron transport regulator)
MRRIIPPFLRAAIAAAVIIFVAVAGWWLITTKRQPAALPSVQFVEFRTGAGEMKKLYLPDSSVVWLNANSRLAWHPDFMHHRETELLGEALFDVRRNDKAPFKVITADSLQTLVLGTSFNIRHYTGLPETQVTVLSGKVQVSHPQISGVMGELTKDQSIRFNHNDHQFAKLAVNAARAGAWTKNEYALQGEGIEAFALLLHNWFDVQVKNSLPRKTSIQLDANFSRWQGREEMLQVFSILAACRYRWIDTNTVELYR